MIFTIKMKWLPLWFILLSPALLSAQKKVIIENEPLVLVNGFKTNLNSLIINPASIDSMQVLNDSLKTLPYGLEGKNGVINISSKKTARLLTAKDILYQYKIAAKDSNLRFAINKVVVKDADKILIEQSEIFTVNITKDVIWVNAEDANAGERFINITTQSVKNN
ncbi:MAG: hypothetical protein JSU03_05815 [Bacteroidetes bacterium]|nr:hypothetical protein [Bacteroidota bacterium]MBS1756776.1 hypothetical protein [Bacteroidota bacterium]